MASGLRLLASNDAVLVEPLLDFATLCVCSSIALISRAPAPAKAQVTVTGELGFGVLRLKSAINSVGRFHALHRHLNSPEFRELQASS